MAKNLETKIVTAAVGMLTTFAVNKLIRMAWKTVTKNDPPDPYDLEVTPGEAIAWVASTTVGVGVAQLLVQRFVQNRYQSLGKSAGLDS